MTRFSRVSVLALAAAFGLAAHARCETVQPNAALQATLGPVTVSIYYQPTPAGYQVVTTASTEQPDSVIRFISVLAPGQAAVVSVPRAMGQPAIELHLNRVGDRIELQRPLS